MNAIQLPFFVEGALILVAAFFGWMIRRLKKPYGSLKIVVHLFFFAWFTMGYFYVFYGLTLEPASGTLWVCALLVGLALVVQITTGVVLLVSKTSRQRLPVVHLTSAIVMLAADIAAFFLGGIVS